MHKIKPLREIVKDNSKAIRLAKKLSQPGVARAAARAGFDIDQSTVSRAETLKNALSVDHLEALAHGLGIPPWQLIMPAGADEGFLFILRAWAKSGDQGKKLLYLAALGAIERDAEAGSAGGSGTTHPRRGGGS